MKKFLLLIALLSLVLVSADDGDLVRFTVINKSGKDIAVSLSGEEEEELYYLTVQAGSDLYPEEKIFTVVRDNYFMQLYYLEIWDPVYGFDCSPQIPTTLNLHRQIRIVVKPCNQAPPNQGAPTMLKFPFRMQIDYGLIRWLDLPLPTGP